jgi:putative nucleotidyltransferase with HDIG domain
MIASGLSAPSFLEKYHLHPGVRVSDDATKTIYQLMRSYDRDTNQHAKRVANTVVRLAQDMGVGKDKIEHWRLGALLHDLGKARIPKSILEKSGKLSASEWQVMRKHPQFGYEELKDGSYSQLTLDIVRYHHERWDGNGYPYGLKGDEIPIAARVTAVVDVWDALTTHRPYRAAWSTEKALIYVKEQDGRQFDPNVVKVFANLEEILMPSFRPQRSWFMKTREVLQKTPIISRNRQSLVYA